ncbi:DNA-directed RNA polymerases II, IV and V subunit 9A isoform X2 [Musa acuminata AAA Group]|uniref:DNA-directed RNA polymerases II, IV and V subunit 9A isoform X2 n=1 Tax=Musa acuminata AAA Group TaxID=214697 RepID=UPI0031D3276B
MDQLRGVAQRDANTTAMGPLGTETWLSVLFPRMKCGRVSSTSERVIRVLGLAKGFGARIGSAAEMSVMKFCRGCNNVLYPKEDREQRILLFACRNCDHQEVADDCIAYRMEINHSVGERSQVLQDVAADPALPRTRNVRCANCNHPEAVFFQAPSKAEVGMALFFICCNPNCGHRWRD